MRFRLLPMAAVVAVLVAACGGSSTPSTTTKKQSSHEASSSQAKTSTSASANTTAATNTSSASSSTSKPTFASVSNCTDLSGVGEQFAKAMSSATSGGKFNLDSAVKAYQGLANAAPGAIRSDVQEIASSFAAFASALSKAHYTFGTAPTASQIAAIESAVKVFDQSKLKSASKAIQAWAVANC